MRSISETSQQRNLGCHRKDGTPQQHFMNNKRFRDYNFITGVLPTGKLNSIADVDNVRVGHFSKNIGTDIRTGVTLIDPGVKNLFHKKIPVAIAIGNGYGKLIGSTQIAELGTLETPIALTGSGSIYTVAHGVFDLVAKTTKHLGPLDSVNSVVMEVNDGRLNTIHKSPITTKEVWQAYKNLKTNFAMGNVGGGVGARAFSWKGGIGSASRVISIHTKRYTLGALVQTNYGGALTILGVPVWKSLGPTDFDSLLQPKSDGSCNIVLATDAPLTSRQLSRIARRAFFALAKTGAVMAHASGDYAIAFSTNRIRLESSGQIGNCLADGDLNSFFLAAVEATEEAIYDALFAARTLTGRAGTTLTEVPREKIMSELKNRGYGNQ